MPTFFGQAEHIPAAVKTVSGQTVYGPPADPEVTFQVFRDFARTQEITEFYLRDANGQFTVQVSSLTTYPAGHERAGYPPAAWINDDDLLEVYDAIGNAYVSWEGAGSESDDLADTPIRVRQNTTTGAWPTTRPGDGRPIEFVWLVANTQLPSWVDYSKDLVWRAPNGPVVVDPIPDPPDTGNPPVTTGPSAPASVTAVPGAAGSGIVTVTFELPTNDGGSPLTNYQRRRSNPDWQDAGLLDINLRDQASYKEMTGFPPSANPYTVGIRCYDGKDWGPWKDSEPFVIPVGGGGGPVAEPPPGSEEPATGSAPMPFPPNKVVAAYNMIYPDSKESLATVSANVNVLHLAFAQGDPPKLVGYGIHGSATALRNAIQALRTRNPNPVRVFISVGGGHNGLNLANRDNFVNGIVAINNELGGLDGLDWDNEGGGGTAINSGLDVHGEFNAVYIMRKLRERIGNNFSCTMAPNGTWIGDFIPVGVALHRAGYLAAFGQQFYDAVVDDGAMKGRISQARSAGIPTSKYYLGMMTPIPVPSYATPAHYWNVDTALTRLASAKAAYPDLLGAYFWERGRPEGNDWMNRVGGAIRNWSA